MNMALSAGRSTALGESRCSRTSCDVVRSTGASPNLVPQLDHLGDPHPERLDPELRHVEQLERRLGRRPVSVLPLDGDIVHGGPVSASARRR